MRSLEVIWSNTLLTAGNIKSSQITEAWCSYVLIISKGGCPTTSLSNVAWYLTILFKKNFLSNI